VRLRTESVNGDTLSDWAVFHQSRGCKNPNALATDFKPATDEATLKPVVAKFLTAESTQSFVDMFNTYFIGLTTKVATNSLTFKTDLASFATAMNTDLSVYRQIVNSAKGVPAVTAEYTYRSVTEPVIPPFCVSLNADLTAHAGGLSDADESKLDTDRIQKALDSCGKKHAVALRMHGEANAFLSGPLQLRAE
jgi:hypothetical protein